MSREEKEAWLKNADNPYVPALLSMQSKMKQQVEEWESMKKGDEVWIKDDGIALDGLKATVRSASMKENSAEVDVDIDGVQQTVQVKLHMLRKNAPVQ